MNFIAKLIFATPQDDDFVQEFRINGNAISVTIPDAPDDPHEPPNRPEVAFGTRIPLGDVHTAIEYTNAAQEFSRRRITLRHIDLRPTNHLVFAVCHERRAIREFRSDRIHCFITQDGEVLTPAEFFRTRFAINIDAPLAPQDPIISEILQHLLPRTSVLVAAARSDRDFHAMEINAILSFIETECTYLWDQRRITNLPSFDQLDSLAKTIATIQPLRKTVQAHLRTCMELDQSEIDRLARALNKVVRADGVIKRPEIAFLGSFHEIKEMGTSGLHDLLGVQ